MSSLLPIAISTLFGVLPLCLAILYLATRKLGSALRELKPIILTFLLFLPATVYSILGLTLSFQTTHFGLAIIAIIALTLLLYLFHRYS